MRNTTAAERLNLACLVGSTREGRRGAEIAHWFAGVAGERDDLAPALLDLADFDFPAHYPEQPTPGIRKFTDELAPAEAFVVITPEYNRSFPASLKQAIDYGYDEWHAKPVGFVSYGFGSPGLYAVEQLRTVFTELHTVTVRDSVGIDLAGTDENCRPVESTHAEALACAAGTLLDQLTWWGLALRDARAARPYVS